MKLYGMRRSAVLGLGAVVCLSAVLHAQQPANAVSPGLSSPSPPDHELADAQNLLDGGKLPAAEAALRAYLRGHETSPQGRYLLAFVLFREDRPAASLAEYTHAATLQKPTPEQLKFVAYDYVLAHDYPDADKWLTRAVASDPADSDLWYSLGRIKFNENSIAAAANCFEKALALSPRLVKAENNLGLTYEALNQMDKAAAAYRTAIGWQAASPRPSEQPLLNLGKVLVQRNQLKEAQPLLQQAETIAPDDASIRAALGQLYEQQGQLAAAQAEFARAVALSPGNAAYHFQLGRVDRKLGATAESRAEFAAAARLDATHSSP